jgi:hypothetical protein
MSSDPAIIASIGASLTGHKLSARRNSRRLDSLVDFLNHYFQYLSFPLVGHFIAGDARLRRE